MRREGRGVGGCFFFFQWVALYDVWIGSTNRKPRPEIEEVDGVVVTRDHMIARNRTSQPWLGAGNTGDVGQVMDSAVTLGYVSLASSLLPILNTIGRRFFGNAVPFQDICWPAEPKYTNNNKQQCGSGRSICRKEESNESEEDWRRWSGGGGTNLTLQMDSIEQRWCGVA